MKMILLYLHIVNNVEVAALTIEEIKASIKNFKNKKAPGHNFVSAELLKNRGTILLKNI